MDFDAVQTSLLSLPLTFQRDGNPFRQWIDALTAGLTRDTSALDQILNQVQNIQNAKYGWLDIWGLLVGVPRFSNEADDIYRRRIIYIVSAGAGTPVGIVKWIKQVWKVDAEISETFGVLGYSITFRSIITLQQAAEILTSIARIRPAGVPLNALEILAVTNSGMFLTTINFLNTAPDVSGAYLTEIGANSGIAVPALYPATNSSEPLLPDLLLTDPTLNPSLAPTG